MVVDVCDRIGIRLRVSDMSGHLPPTEKKMQSTAYEREKQVKAERGSEEHTKITEVSVSQVAS